jgi:hypothetical protein
MLWRWRRKVRLRGNPDGTTGFTVVIGEKPERVKGTSTLKGVAGQTHLPPASAAFD